MKIHTSLEPPLLKEVNTRLSSLGMPEFNDLNEKGKIDLLKHLTNFLNGQLLIVKDISKNVISVTTRK